MGFRHGSLHLSIEMVVKSVASEREMVAERLFRKHGSSMEKAQ